MNVSESARLLLKHQENLELPFVYCLWDGVEIVYVGKTEDIITRVISHINSSKIFDSVSLKECSKEDMNDKEITLIKNLRPKYNKKDNPDYRRPEDLNAKVDESLKEIIQGATKRTGFNGVMALSRACDISYERVSRVYGGSVSAKLSDVAHVADVLGLKIKFVDKGEK